MTEQPSPEAVEAVAQALDERAACDHEKQADRDHGIFITCQGCDAEATLVFVRDAIHRDGDDADAIRAALGLSPEPEEWGVMFHDNSVMHRWNGRTQRQRATEEWDRLRVKYAPDNIRLTSRRRFAGEWQEVQP